MTDAKPIGIIVRGLVLSAIDTCPCLRTKLERIKIAERCGIITPEEAAEKMAIVERMAA
ncbi:hypothetical protein [Sphingomonas sp.]|uniref:hypothetical protein n=1 Tax=Sphingomonas sp. TaxID=28214 RepID=UPI002FD9C836